MSGIDLVHGFGEFLRLVQVRRRGLPPHQVGVFRKRDAALDAVRQTGAGLEAIETFRGALAGDELAIALVDVGGDQLGASASVRASTKVGVPQTSAASRAAIRLRSCAAVGISTLPPMWPHFFSDAS